MSNAENLSPFLQIHCFGPLQVQSGTKVVERFRTQKTASLLALLALRGARSREELCEMLWPDSPPEAARNSLSAALSSLRRELGENSLQADRFQVALAPNLFLTDVAVFDNAWKANEYSSCVQTYRGHLLPGFYDEPFPALSREYEEKARVAFSKHLEALESGSNFHAVVETSRRGLYLFPGTLDWYLTLMRAHRALRNFDGALGVYNELVAFARKNNDLVPDAARHLARQIRREREMQPSATTHAPSLVSSTRDEPNDNKKIAESSANDDSTLPKITNSDATTSVDVSTPAAPAELCSPTLQLPTFWTRFFGREVEIGHLLQVVRTAGLVTLSGIGGSGKTRLALEVAKRAASEWNNCVYFVSLAPLTDVELLFSTIRDALNQPTAPDLPPLQQIVNMLRDTPTLFVLDNFEQLVEGGAAKIQQLRAALPHVTWLVTSRVLLHVPGEREFALQPLPTPHASTRSDELLSYASVALFCDRAGLQIGDQYAGGATMAPSVNALCRRLDGIPLALELAAARTSVLTPAQILERLETRLDILQTREHGVPERQRTLRATIEWSYELLPPEVQAFFARLSVFRGGWTLEAAEAICADPDEADAVLDRLEILRNNSLLLTLDTPHGTRFRLLELLREWGAGKLAQDEALREQLHVRHFEYYLQLIEQHQSTVLLVQHQAELDAESDNFRAALGRVLERDDATATNDAARMASALCAWWSHKSLYAEGREWLLRVLRKSGFIEPLWRARLVSGGGSIMLSCGEFVPAQSLLEEGLQLSRSLGDEATECYALHRLGFAMLLRGQHEFAAAMCEESLKIARKRGDVALLFGAYISVGWTYINTFRLEETQEIMEQCRTLAREVGSCDMEAMALIIQSYASLMEGETERAVPISSRSYQLAQDGELNPWFTAFATAIRGTMARQAGELKWARELGASGIETFYRIGTRWEVSSALSEFGMVLVDLEEMENAATVLGAAQALRRRINHPMLPTIERFYTPRLQTLRATLDEATLHRHWNIGAQMPLEEVVSWVQKVAAEGD